MFPRRRKNIDIVNRMFTEFKKHSVTTEMLENASLENEYTKLKLRDYQARLNQTQNKYNQELGSLDNKKRALVAQINEISTNLKGLEENRVNFPTQLLQIRAEIEEGLKRISRFVKALI